jgi:putative ABC transport system permease protein
VGALGLFSTLTMNVLERRREIGVMRTVGASTGTLLWTFLLEGLLLGLLGWAIGNVLGAPAGRMLVEFLSDKLVFMEYVFPPESVVITLIAVVLVAFIASIGPAMAAARMRIADILRYG